MKFIFCFSKPRTANNSEFWANWDKTERDGTGYKDLSQKEWHIPEPPGCLWRGLKLHTLLLESCKYRKGEDIFSLVSMTDFKSWALDFTTLFCPNSKVAEWGGSEGSVVGKRSERGACCPGSTGDFEWPCDFGPGPFGCPGSSAKGLDQIISKVPVRSHISFSMEDHRDTICFPFNN